MSSLDIVSFNPLNCRGEISSHQILSVCRRSPLSKKIQPRQERIQFLTFFFLTLVFSLISLCYNSNFTFFSLLTPSSGSLPLRFLVPPSLFFFLLPRTNPQLSSNLGSYYKDLESQYLPTAVKESRESIFQSWRDLKSQVGQGVKSVEEGTKSGWEKAREGAEGVTGLKVGGK